MPGTALAAAAAQPEGTHTFTVRACDDDETEDGVPFSLCDDTPAAWTYVIDTTGPAAGFASGPAPGARLRTPPTYTFSGGEAPAGQAPYRCMRQAEEEGQEAGQAG